MTANTSPLMSFKVKVQFQRPGFSTTANWIFLQKHDIDIVVIDKKDKDYLKQNKFTMLSRNQAEKKECVM